MWSHCGPRATYSIYKMQRMDQGYLMMENTQLIILLTMQQWETIFSTGYNPCKKTTVMIKQPILMLILQNCHILTNKWLNWKKTQTNQIYIRRIKYLTWRRVCFIVTLKLSKLKIKLTKEWRWKEAMNKAFKINLLKKRQWKFLTRSKW